MISLFGELTFDQYRDVLEFVEGQILAGMVVDELDTVQFEVNGVILHITVKDIFDDVAERFG